MTLFPARRVAAGLSACLWLLTLLSPGRAQAQQTVTGETPMVKLAEPPKFVADLSIDVQANLYGYARKQQAIALELSPRFGLLLANFFDLGLNFVAGYGSSTHSWSQSTVFGVGPYVGTRLTLTPTWRLVPWVAVMYHQAFIAGFEPGPDTGTTDLGDVAGLRQIIRIDAHLDAVFHPGKNSGLSLGAFVKNRVASFDDGLGRARELDAGVRIGAVSYF